MCGILIDGVIPIAVLSAVTGHDLGSFFKAGLVAFGASIVAAIVSGALSVLVPSLLAQLVGLAVAATCWDSRSRLSTRST